MVIYEVNQQSSFRIVVMRQTNVQGLRGSLLHFEMINNQGPKTYLVDQAYLVDPLFNNNKTYISHEALR